MKKDDVVFVQHILDAIKHIEEFTAGLTKSDFLHSIKTQDAVVRRLEVIGEATKNISKTFRQKHTDIPWEDMAGMRDKLIHHYFKVDLTIVWNVSTKELPKVKKSILKIIEEK